MNYLIGGESHGPALVGIVEGVPRGLELTSEMVDTDLAERQKGFGRSSRMAIEKDSVSILSGVRQGVTTGGPITLLIQNRVHKSWQEVMSAEKSRACSPTEDNVENYSRCITVPRPGHADLAGAMRWQTRDARDVLELSSARRTAMTVAIGAISRQLLASVGIDVLGFVVALGKVRIPLFDYPDRLCPPDSVEFSADRRKRENSSLPFANWREKICKSDFRTVDEKSEKKMRSQVERAMRDGDSLGGIIQINAAHLPAGLGKFELKGGKLSARLGEAVLSVPAIKGVEFGYGFRLASMRGSEAVDPFFPGECSLEQGKKLLFSSGGCTRFRRLTNRMGGLEGGMTDGEPLILRAVMKPVPTVARGVSSFDMITGKAALSHRERADTCAVRAASVVLEAVVLNTLAAMLLEEFGSTTLARFKKAYFEWKKEWEKYR